MYEPHARSLAILNALGLPTSVERDIWTAADPEAFWNAVDLVSPDPDDDDQGASLIMKEF